MIDWAGHTSTAGQPRLRLCALWLGFRFAFLCYGVMMGSASLTHPTSATMPAV